MRPFVLSGLLLLSTSTVAAQEAATKTALQEYESLIADFNEANVAYAKARSAIAESDEFKKAQDAQDQTALAKLMAKAKAPDVRAFVKRAKASAEKFAGDAGQAQFLVWIATHSGQRQDISNAIDSLMSEHLESEALLPLAARIGGMGARLGQERVDEVVETLAELSPHSMVQANARFSRAMAQLRSRDDEAIQAAYDELELVQEMVPDTDLAQQAAAPLFEARNLQIGMAVPDIAGEDLDGVGFKLSDYRGKVVVLDFWGDW